ncbi:MAG: DUF6765 family protein [Nitrospirota bacterium]
MDIEYHYYITFLIALRAGFKRDEAYKIAYASQYTDDNDTSYAIDAGRASSSIPSSAGWKSRSWIRGD